MMCCCAQKGKNCGCLAAGTRISTPMGDVPIKHIYIGDCIMNPFDDGPLLIVEDVMTGVEEEMIKLECSNGSILVLTFYHPVHLKRGFVPASLIKINDEVLTADSSFTTVVNISKEKLEEREMVYNLIVQDTHAFIAENLVVGDLIMQNQITR